ncbi:MAG: hypothetical protein R6U96_03260 [Promethearchaeia archaeon]
MKLLYFDADKGKFFAVIGALVLAILIGARIIFTILGNFFPIIEIILNSLTITLFNRVFDLDGVIFLAIIFYIYLIIDGFIDGIPMSIAQIIILLLIFFIGTETGKVQLLFSFDLLDTFIILDLSIVLFILFFVSIGLILFEIILFRMKVSSDKIKDKEGKEKEKGDDSLAYEKLTSAGNSKGLQKILSYLPFSTGGKKKEKWIDRKKGKLNLRQDESPVLKDWKMLEGNSKESAFRFYIISTSILLFTGLIYGIIRYFIFDLPAPGDYYNNFMTGLFFPMYVILLTSFLSIRHFLRASILTILVISINFILRDMGIITVEGIFLLAVLVDVLNWFFIDLAPFLNQMTSEQLLTLLVFIINIVIQVQFFLLMLNLSFRYLKGKGSKMEIFSSNQFLYLRKKEKFNTWMISFDFLTLAVWPYNPNNWRNIWNKLKFKIHSMREGIELNYGRLSYANSIKKIKKIRRTKWKFILKIILIILFAPIIWAMFSIPYSFGYVLLILVLVETWRFMHGTDKIKIKIKFKSKKTQGSFFMLSNENVLTLYNVPMDVAALIPSV